MPRPVPLQVTLIPGIGLQVLGLFLMLYPILAVVLYGATYLAIPVFAGGRRAARVCLAVDVEYAHRPPGADSPSTELSPYSRGRSEVPVHCPLRCRPRLSYSASVESGARRRSTRALPDVARCWRSSSRGEAPRPTARGLAWGPGRHATWPGSAAGGARLEPLENPGPRPLPAASFSFSPPRAAGSPRTMASSRRDDRSRADVPGALTSAVHPSVLGLYPLGVFVRC